MSAVRLASAAPGVAPVAADAADAADAAADGASAVHEVPFEAVYDEHFDFVWRSLLRLGVAPASADDAAQDVFLVVHRQLKGFAGRSSMKTWLFAIAINVARDHRRTLRRKGGHESLDDLRLEPASDPDAHAERLDAAHLLDRALEVLDEQKRAVFVLAELEGMTGPEIAQATGLNANTVSSRLRVARQQFQQAFTELKAGQR